MHVFFSSLLGDFGRRGGGNAVRFAEAPPLSPSKLGTLASVCT